MSASVMPWRVAEFWSSANPGKACLMLAKDGHELTSWELRSDFVRWHSPDPLAAPVKECLTADVPTGTWFAIDHADGVQFHPSKEQALRFSSNGECVPYYSEAELLAHTARAVAEALASSGGAETANSASNSETAPVPKGSDGGADAALATTPASAPIDMVLRCPACRMQHIDAPAHGWDNAPHRSHLCHGCGHIWRPADVPTNGVAAIKTTGKADSAPASAQAVANKGLVLSDDHPLSVHLRGLGIQPNAEHAVAPAQVEKEPTLVQSLEVGNEREFDIHPSQCDFYADEGFKVRKLYTRPQAAQPAAQVAGQRLPEGVTIQSFKAEHDSVWWITIKHPFGTTSKECSQSRDAELAQLLSTPLGQSAQVAGLTDAEILQMFAQAVGNENEGARYVEVCPEEAIEFARAILAAKSAPADGGGV